MKRQTLIFQWQERPHLSLALPAFLALSALLHALTFYIFQIAYPSEATVPPPPAQVSFLSSSNPQHQSLLNWVEAEDPARAARPTSHIPPSLLASKYRASYEQTRPLPPFLEEEKEVMPQGLDFQNLFKDQKTPKQPSATASMPSRVVFFGPLRQPSITLEPIAPSASANLAPARFLVGVSHQGRASYVFKEESSGDTYLDQQVEKQLLLATYPPAKADVAWGYAVAVWGAEAFAETGKKP